MHMIHMFFFSACIGALYFVNANIYYMISMFIYTQQLTSVTMSCQLSIARCVLNFSVNDIQEMDNCHVYARSVLYGSVLMSWCA